ncbi:MAG: ATP-dependent helicase HrpB [Myxococcaceae bacterium]|jgi:ATP-dependent helicase HrpB|nr:ATP-dependent helicase HrpB [Myxococcaceae bacterium]
MQPLPIDPLLPELVAALRAREAAVLEAPPGAGKTTRVPPALLDAGLSGGKELVVLQPRRLATRLAAARVARERGERLGETVGYQVRFDDVSSAKTRIRFVTEGLLTRRLVGDPQLRDVGLVVLDEFHERHLAGDLALAMLRRLQQTTRPDLKLVVMSATLDAAPISAWLSQAPRLRSEGRRFDVALEYLDKEDERPLEQQVLAALKRLVQASLDGHVLVFLPGASEIRRAHDACADFAQRHQLELVVLHGDLSASEQDRALEPGHRRKVILSTNVAETSVTIEGVAAVVDSGLARVAAHSPFSGLPTLKVQKVSKSSAIQRAGRAGRTRAGVCVRLYTRGDYEGRPASDAPEIRRLDFVESALALRALGITDVRQFPYFEAPPPQALEAAEALLLQLGALERSGALTAVGRRLLSFPLHPRLARLVVAGETRGVANDAATLAALLGERDLRLETRVRFGDARRGSDALSGPSDLLELLERFKEGMATSARSAGLDAAAMQTVERVRRQLSRQLDTKAPAPRDDRSREEALLQAVLAAFPDRVARRRRPKAPEVIFAAGGSATLDPTSVVHDAELLVAVDAEERRGGVVVRLASQVEAEWLLDVSGDALGESDALEWNEGARRVDRVTRLTFGNVTLEETRGPAPASEETSRLLAAAALEAGVRPFAEPEAVVAWQCRVEALRGAFPGAGFPTPDDAFVKERLRALCEGLRSFTEVREAGLLQALHGALTPQQARLLHTEAPDRLTLPGGRTVQVHYEVGRPPWIESRLQDFFGLLKGPAIGRAPLVLHLLAPSGRAVQVTTDLSGFWERHYPAIRKELMRQYPKHAWPEDPKTATPPAPRRR